jgi:hypothetical protein
LHCQRIDSAFAGSELFSNIKIRLNVLGI